MLQYRQHPRVYCVTSCKGILTITLPQSQVQSWWSLLFPIVTIVLIVFILDYYVESVSANRLDVFNTSRYGAYALFTSALALGYFWTYGGSSGDVILSRIGKGGSVEHGLSGGVVFSGLLFILGELWFTTFVETPS